MILKAIHWISMLANAMGKIQLLESFLFLTQLHVTLYVCKPTTITSFSRWEDHLAAVQNRAIQQTTHPFVCTAVRAVCTSSNRRSKHNGQLDHNWYNKELRDVKNRVCSNCYDDNRNKCSQSSTIASLFHQILFQNYNITQHVNYSWRLYGDVSG